MSDRKPTSIQVINEADTMIIYVLMDDGSIWSGSHGRQQNTTRKVMKFRKFNVEYDEVNPAEI